MPTTRRMNGITADPLKTTSRQATPTKAIKIPPPKHPAYVPTRTETLLLSIYPLTLVLGSLFSYLSPSLRPPTNASTYSTIHQSFQPPSAAPSYFAQKRNIFNVYFVKIGWFWCTLAFFAFVLFVSRGRSAADSPGTSGSEATERRPGAAKAEDADRRLQRLWQAALRYFVATAFWIITTQWFLGAPLVDRGFAFTGGVCELATEKLQELEWSGGAEVAARQKEEVARLVSHAACRVAGGLWKGGYDISGHVFILVLGSGMLWFEMLPFLLPRVKGLGLGRVVQTAEGKVLRIAQELAGTGATDTIHEGDNRNTDTTEKKHWAVAMQDLATSLGLGVAVLSWWMLLMTAAYFHTWFEKLTGWIWASFALWVIYFLPRANPLIRSIVGMPGV